MGRVVLLLNCDTLVLFTFELSFFELSYFISFDEIFHLLIFVFFFEGGNIVFEELEFIEEKVFVCHERVLTVEELNNRTIAITDC